MSAEGDPSARRFGPWLKFTAWLAGLMLAFVTGNLSAYVVLSAVYFGSSAARKLGKRQLERLRSGS